MLSGKHSLCSTHGPAREQPGSHFPRCGLAGPEHMNSRICVCCGEPMPEKGNHLSRNPNICASCSSMADGMEESCIPESSSPALERTEAAAPDRSEENAPERSIHHFPM
jgi:hypothetical protein